MAEASATNAGHETKISGLQSEVESLTRDREAAMQLGEELDRQLAKATEEIEGLTRARDTALRNGEQLTRELAEAHGDINSLSGERNEARKEIERISSELVEWRNNADRITKELDGARENIGLLTEARDTAVQEGGRLARELAQTQGNAEELAREVAAAQARGDDLTGKLDEANRGIEALTQARDAAVENGAQLTAELESAMRVNEEALTKLSEAQGEVRALTEQRDLAEAQIAELAAKLDTEIQQSHSYSTAHSQAQAQCDEFAARLAELEVQLTGISAERDTASQVCEDVTKELSESRQQLDSARRQNRELSDKLDEQRRQVLAITKSRGGVPQEMVDAVMKERDDTKAIVADLEEKLSSAQAQISALATEREALQRSTGAAKQAETERLRAELTAAREDARKPRVEPTPQVVPPQRRFEEPRPVQPVASADLMERQPPPLSVHAQPPSHAHAGRPDKSTTIKIDVDGALLRRIIDTTPEALNGMRRHLHAFIKNQAETGLLEQLLLNLRGLTEQTSHANLTSVHTMAYALEQLIADLMKIPCQINPSTLRTVSQSLDFLATLLDEKNLSRTKDPYLSNIFAVDDDHEARRVIRSAMEMVSLKVTCAEDPKTTLAVLNEQRFDLIFIDVGLPEMNGFDLCTKIRKLPDHKKTPVVFLTGAVTVQNRVQSSLSGGNDFIAKPFNLLELGVKALTWIFKGQLGML